MVFLNIYFSTISEDEKNHPAPSPKQTEKIGLLFEKDKNPPNPQPRNLDHKIKEQIASLNKTLTGYEIHSSPSLFPESPAVNSYHPQGVGLQRIEKDPELKAFIQEVVNGKENLLSGIFAKNVMALKIAQQPEGNPAFVSSESETVTQFQNASVYGVIGLLAHNYLSGKHFYNLKLNDEIVLIFGDGKYQRYQIKGIHNFERLTRNDIKSDFLDLKSKQAWSARKVFQKFYQGEHHLTLQTCIEKDGIWNWGVRFIVAEPIISNE